MHDLRVVALTAKQIEQFRKILTDRVAELYQQTRGDVRDESARARDEPWAQDDSPQDEADSASNVQQSELQHSMDERQAALAQAMEAALGRIRDGSYGTCVECGNDIELERLKLVPWTTLCIEDQEALEQARQHRPPTM